jgi:hypothetical protein
VKCGEEERWIDCEKNTAMYRAKKERNILHTIKRKKIY